jgi:hypothetical protein
MPTGIEVTPEMIEAGVEALARLPEPNGDNALEIVTAVYIAMERSRRAKWPQWAA